MTARRGAIGSAEPASPIGGADLAEEWEETFRAVQDLLVVLDGDGRVLRANRGYEGREATDLVGLRAADLFDFCAGEGGGPVGEVLRTGREASAEILDQDPERALSVSAFPVRGGAVSKVVLCVRDVTARRRIEAQLFQSAKLAAIGEMAAGVAHELNSPLTAVIGNAGLLLRRTPEEDRAYRMLADIKACGQRCKKIISNMLTFARQDSYVFEPVQLEDAVRSALDLIVFQLEKAGVSLEMHFDAGLPAVLGNPQQIEQIVVNLLLNARDAVEGAPEKRICVTTELGSFESGRLGVAASVSDTGPGIGASHLDRIFDPFFTTKDAKRGTGLGLSVSLGIAKAHGGTLVVESRPGVGSTFRLLLPLMDQQLSEYLTLGGAKTGDSPAPEALREARPGLALARALGRLLAQLAADDLREIEVECPREAPRGLLANALLEGLLASPANGPVNLGNARAIARARGVRLVESAAPGEGYSLLLRVRAATGSETVTLVGVLHGRGEPRLLTLDGRRLETVLEGHLLLFWARDRPGLLGSIASLLASRGVDIRQMRAAEPAGDAAVAVFSVDNPVGDDLLAELRALPGVLRVARTSF